MTRSNASGRRCGMRSASARSRMRKHSSIASAASNARGAAPQTETAPRHWPGAVAGRRRTLLAVGDDLRLALVPRSAVGDVLLLQHRREALHDRVVARAGLIVAQ